MKPYEEYRETLTKDKKSKAMVQVSADGFNYIKEQGYCTQNKNYFTYRSASISVCHISCLCFRFIVTFH